MASGLGRKLLLRSADRGSAVPDRDGTLVAGVLIFSEVSMRARAGRGVRRWPGVDTEGVFEPVGSGGASEENDEPLPAATPDANVPGASVAPLLLVVVMPSVLTLREEEEMCEISIDCKLAALGRRFPILPPLRPST